MPGRASVAIALGDEERGFLEAAAAQAQGSEIVVRQVPDPVEVC